MLKRSHFLPLLLATSPLAVTTTTSHPLQNNDVHHHLRRQHLLQPSPSMPNIHSNNQQQPPAKTRNKLKRTQRQRQQRRLGKSNKAKSSKHSRDGYYQYSMSYNSLDYNSDTSEETIASQNGLNDNNEQDEGEGGDRVVEDGDDLLLPPIQVSFDILSDTNNEGDVSSTMVDDGDAIKGHGSEAEAEQFSSFSDRPGGSAQDDAKEEQEGPNPNNEGDVSSTTVEDGDAINGLGSEAEAESFSSFNRTGGGAQDDGEEEEDQEGSVSTQATTSDQEVSTTSTEAIDGEFPTTTTNSTNTEVVQNWEINPSGRTSAIAAAGLISIVSLGSIVFVSVGLFLHAKRSKTEAAALAGGAAANNVVDDGSVDAPSIWSANEGGDVAAAAAGGDGQPMSPQPTGISSIAAIGMASPLALQLSGRSLD